MFFRGQENFDRGGVEVVVGIHFYRITRASEHAEELHLLLSFITSTSSNREY